MKACKAKSKSTAKYVIGVDYGTDSCRALIVDTKDGREIAASVSYYPRWKAGKYCDPKLNQYRQHPLDYIESMENAVKGALKKAPKNVANNIVGISFDTTGSTPVLIDKNGTPLALLPEFAENPNAMFVLWKDHTAIKEAGEINELAHKSAVDFTAYEGGIYSSEWVWSKVLHILRNDEKVRNAAYSWLEHCDWMPALLTGQTQPEKILRSRCAAGHKAMWNEAWNGLPSEEFLVKLDPLLKGMRDRLFTETHTGDELAGYITPEWAKRLGLPEGIAVAVGIIDAHMGAVGSEIKPNILTRIMGTSTCDIIVSSKETMGDKLVPGICGQVNGSVLPGYVGLEAGQSAFGDIYAWFKEVLAWPIRNILAKSKVLDKKTKEALIAETIDSIIPALTKEAQKVPVSESSIIAVDWMNGRRTPDANQLLKGTITGLTLGSSAPLIFRALVEATAFGSKAIVDRFIEQGVKIDSIIAIGGISQKSPFVMQTLADVLNMPIKVIKSEQACALGAAMFAAVVGGVYKTVEEAQDAMGAGFAKTYKPNAENHKLYLEIYKKYQALGKFTETAIFNE